MVAGDGEVPARTDAPVAASRWPTSGPAGRRIDAGTLSAAAEVSRHHAQRVEAHRQGSVPVPQAVRDDDSDAHA
jgi:hypothetical protein